MAINIDMEKAFDKMEWSFILSIIHKLGIKDKWINWIRLCISTTSFSVLLNSSPFGHFRPSRGLRQGDPLSPFLFIIGTEALSRLLHHSLRGFCVSWDNMAINHVLFADDLVIFTSATSSEASIIKTCLDKYSTGSGQSINICKSNILFSKNTTSSTISGIQGFLPFAITPVSAKHLGLPMLIGRSKKSAFFDILDKVNGKIEGWRSKTLSQVGKSVLIKVVASSIPSYAMSSFFIPDELCHRLDMAFKKFWWGFPKDKSHNLSLKSWTPLCLLKNQGGLGFLLMKDVNISLISKLGWKLLVDHDCLWVSLFKNKYFKYGNLLTSPLPKGFFIWNGIKSIVHFLKSGACYIPHLLSSLAIWFSPWVPTLPDFRPAPRVESLQANFPLAILDMVSSTIGTWNLPLLEFLFDQAYVSEILKIRIWSANDSLLWTPSSTGVFSTQLADRFFTSQRTPVVSTLHQSSWKLLWKFKLNHRLRIFLWKMVWNILPTKERFSSAICSQSISDSTCSLCSFSTDSLVHLFLSCSIARVVWRNSLWPLDIIALRISSMADWLHIILHPHTIGIPASDSHLFQIFAAVACDQIWLARNKAHHENLVPNALTISIMTNRLSNEHYGAWKLQGSPYFPVWKWPIASTFKINYDTAIRDTFSAQSAVCCDSNGSVIHCLVQVSPPCTAIYGEVSAALLAAKLALSLKLPSVIFEGDSLMVTLVINNPSIM